MKKSVLVYALVFFVFIQLVCTWDELAHAQDSGQDNLSIQILEIINHIRCDPLNHLPELGIDVTELLKSRPEMESFLSSGMAALEKDHRLNEAADFFAGLRFDGWVFNQFEACQIITTDFSYQVIYYGNAFGLLVFDNYIEPDQAARILLRQIFEDNLSQDFSEHAGLLDPSLRQMGYSFGAKTFQHKGRTINGYFLNIELASGLDFAAEGYLEILINEFRKEPEGIIQELDLDPEIINARLDDESKMVLMASAPLAWNRTLFETARILGHLLSENVLDMDNAEDLEEVLGLYLDTLGFDFASVNLIVGRVALSGDLSYKEVSSSILASLLNGKRLSVVDPARIFLMSKVSEMVFKIMPVDKEDDQITLLVVGILTRPKIQRYHVLGRVSDDMAPLAESCHNCYGDFQIRGLSNIEPRYHLSGIDPLGRYQLRFPGLNIPFAIMDLTLENKTNSMAIQNRIFLNNNNIRVDF